MFGHPHGFRRGAGGLADVDGGRRRWHWIAGFDTGGIAYSDGVYRRLDSHGFSAASLVDNDRAWRCGGWVARFHAGGLAYIDLALRHTRSNRGNTGSYMNGGQ